MWNAPKDEIPESQIAKHALSVLAEYTGEFEPGPEISDALAYLEKRPTGKPALRHTVKACEQVTRKSSPTALP